MMATNEEKLSYPELRQKLHKQITEILKNSDEDLAGVVTGVTGWILIAEIAGPGERNLIAISGDLIGDSDLPPWTARGWIDEVGEDVKFYLGQDASDEDDED